MCNNCNKTKVIAEQTKWNRVADELAAEKLKLASYDHTLLPALGNVSGQKVLDYGAGPGVLALTLQKMGADVKVWDINPEMREKAGKKIGNENVFHSVSEIPTNHFNIVICNLVVCIVPETEVRAIAENIRKVLRTGGTAYIGFCNPKIFQVVESNLDFRQPTGNAYEENHRYQKIKKEGGYKIIEDHRPLEWYEEVFTEAGLKVEEKIFTPEYELGGSKIQDFVIFKLSSV